MTAKLVVVLLILVGTLYFLWIVDSAMSYQYRVLKGCWPESVEVDGKLVLSEVFWLREVENLELNRLEQFFFSRVRHRILFYLMVLFAVIGWCGSFFLRIFRQARGTASTESLRWTWMLASLILAGLSSGILFLLLVSARLILNPGGSACISEGYAYLAAVSALGSGLFVELFFDWFRSIAKSLWAKNIKP